MFFNLILFFFDAITLGIIARHTKIWVCLTVGILFAMAGIYMGVSMATSNFHLARLAAYGLFLHTPIVLFGAAVVWRKQHMILTVGLAVAAVCILAVEGYAFLIEPFWLEITHYRISSPKIKRPLRIVVIADFQTSKFGEYEARVLDETLVQKPDIILLAGDYLQVPFAVQPGQIREINTYLRKIGFSAPQGIYAVQGNIDGYNWPKLFAGLNVNVVQNRRHFALDDLTITCLGLLDSMTGDEVENPDPKKFDIVLGHVPNFALGKINADLLVAGHTHGGQVQLPFIGALTTASAIPKSWAAGMTNLPGGSKLLVSRGIGMEGDYAPRMRFLCRPELAVIDLTPEKSGEE
jgi:uncharacterized protein